VVSTRKPIIAHRGFSSRQPESTLAAYRDAIGWAATEGRPLLLECDVHFSADDQLVCLHDLRVDRTSTASGMAVDLTVEELRSIDFGSWKVPHPSPDQRRLVTLDELLDLMKAARAAGHDISLAVETKHPNPRGRAVERRLAQMLAARGWDQPGSPVRVMSFSLDAILLAGELLPNLERTLLIEQDFGPWLDGDLPDGVEAVGPDLALVLRDPEFVARAHAHGNQVLVWTVNEPDDIRLCIFLRVDGFITDYPDRVAEALAIFAE
jgi:glycerophosphoryl diester phosphodiesterase